MVKGSFMRATEVRCDFCRRRDDPVLCTRKRTHVRTYACVATKVIKRSAISKVWKELLLSLLFSIH